MAKKKEAFNWLPIIKERGCHGCKYADPEKLKKNILDCSRWEEAIVSRDIDGECALRCDRRIAFFIMETQKNEAGEFIALIAVEGKEGFTGRTGTGAKICSSRVRLQKSVTLG